MTPGPANNAAPGGQVGSRTGGRLAILLAVLIGVVEFAGSLHAWHSLNPHGLFQIALHSLAFLAAIWSLLLLVAEGYSALLRKLRESGGGILYAAARMGGSLAAALAWVFVAVDLTARRALGSFLNPSLIQFAYENMANGLWAHTAGHYRRMMLGLGVFLVVTAPLVFLWVWRHGAELRLLGHPRRRRPALYAMLAAAAAFTLSLAAINGENRRDLKTRAIRHVFYNVEPVLAFGLGWADLYRQMHDDSARLDDAALVPRAAAFQPPALANRPNIIFFQIESCRPDVVGMVWQGIEVTPNLNRLARRGTRFTRAYAPGTHTSLSNVAIATSLGALRTPLIAEYPAHDPHPATLIYDVLKPLGYDTAWISSDFEAWAGMKNILETPRLDTFIDATYLQERDHPELLGKHILIKLEPDSTTLGEATNWIAGELGKKKPFYLTLSLSDSHFPYESSMNSNWFQPCGIPDSWTIYDYPESATNQVRNTYFNAIHGIDLLLGRLMDYLAANHAHEHTIIVAYGDHGESFWENGVISHGNLPYDPSARTTLVMSGPGFIPEGKVDDYPVSLIDAVPTVLGRLGLPHHPNFQGTDILSPSRPPAETRCVYIHADGRINGDGMVAAGRWKYFVNNCSGASFLYDLASDPGETNNLAPTQTETAAVLAKQLDDYCAGQLAYYRLPRYYTKYYPPMPPQISVR